MTDITQYMPKTSPIADAIYAVYKKRGDAEEHRGYLGASIIGHPCDRFLWYTFRACCREDFPGRIYRLFETGDLEEIRMVKNLRDIGCTVHDVDPATGEQFEVSDIGGHFSGHMDGCGLGIPGAEKTWHVLEFKTHNAKSFAKLKKEGVEASKPVHYAQMQAYMHKTGMKRALYLAENKDTDELYPERVYYESFQAKGYMERAKRIIFANEPPERMTDRPDWWECKFCSAHSLCWGTGDVALPVPDISCRQCCHATPTMDGNARWVCEKHARGLSIEDQHKACDDHLVLPGLLSFAEPSDYGKDPAGNDYIEFTNIDGSKWMHGGIGYTSTELHTLPVPALVNKFLESAKGLFNAEATGHCADDILSRYPEEDSRIVWRGESSKLAEAWKNTYCEDISKLTPIAKCDGFGYQAVEFEFGDTGRMAIVYSNRKAEIREGVV